MQTGWFSLLVAGVLGTGCTASMFIHGGTLTDQDYAPNSKAQYTASACTELASGNPSKQPTATYYVVDDKGQPALFERSSKGGGTLITNRWTAVDGEHYFSWVHHSGARNGDGAITAMFRTSYERGWEYIVPASGVGVRLMYNDCKMSKGADGVTKPTSQANIKCELTPGT